MKALSIIINRLRWVSLGVYLTLIFIAWLESDDKKTEEKSDPYNFNNYKHNHFKETSNA